MTTIDKVKSTVEYIQESGVPYFYPGMWFDASQELSEEDVPIAMKGKLFPFVFLHVDIDEDVNVETNEVKTKFNLYVTADIDLDKNMSIAEQHEQIFPAIREIEEKLLKAFKRKKCKFIKYNRKEHFHVKTEKNKLNSDVCVIQMKFSEFTYFKNC